MQAGGFADRVRELPRAAPAVRADETPARTAGGLCYVRLACTACLTLMHAGDRSAEAIGADGVLPGYTGIIVRDGCAGLTGALHAWCGARLLRDLKDRCDFEAGRQDWAQDMAALLIEARRRPPGREDRPGPAGPRQPDRPPPGTGRGRANLCRRTATAKDARRTARRLPAFEDMILRLATRPDLDIFTDNEAERTIRPVKVQQCSSGGCRRTIERLADFAVVQSYLSTAAKWETGKLDALRDLFNGHARIPPAPQPAA